MTNLGETLKRVFSKQQSYYIMTKGVMKQGLSKKIILGVTGL